jgi:tRNA(Ile)-lysidine synthase
MSFSPQALLLDLRVHLPAEASGQLCVAFSGGLDSTVLLHALSLVRGAQSAFEVRAVHVDHGLQSLSGEWAAHCVQAARKLDIECAVAEVTVDRDAQEGIEAAARAARYAALNARLRPGETLLTAHHADDQLETLLLALARGSGLIGLSGMPPLQTVGEGWHLRPMLAFTRAEIETWARERALAWISDPTNDSARFSRNLLRSRVVPALEDRWPAIARTATRSAAHLREAATLLEEFAQLDLRVAAAGPCLRVAEWMRLSAARRRNVLRSWLRRQGVRAPSTRKLLALEHDVLNAAEDRLPQAQWDDCEIRRYRGLLYAHARLPVPRFDQSIEWDWSTPLELGQGLGRLVARRGAAQGLDEARLPRRLHVDFRREGAKLKPVGRAHHHRVKKLLQDSNVLPWWRSQLPMIRNDDALIAVGDLWIAAQFSTGAPHRAVEIVWEDRPPIFAVDGGASDGAID